MIKINFVSFDKKEYPSICLDDTYAECCQEVLVDLEQVDLPGGLMIFVEFTADKIDPSVVAITIGFLNRIYDIVAIPERGWDAYIVVALSRDIEEKYKNQDVVFRIGDPIK